MHRIVYIILLAFIFFPTLLMAQPVNPAGDPDNPVPITGIEILIGAGALLGAKKLLQRNLRSCISITSSPSTGFGLDREPTKTEVIMSVLFLAFIIFMLFKAGL